MTIDWVKAKENPSMLDHACLTCKRRFPGSHVQEHFDKTGHAKYIRSEKFIAVETIEVVAGRPYMPVVEKSQQDPIKNFSVTSDGKRRVQRRI